MLIGLTATWLTEVFSTATVSIGTAAVPVGGTTLTRNTPARQTTPFARYLSHEVQFDACAGPGTLEVGGSRFGMTGASAGSAGSVGDEKLASCSRWSLERGDYYYVCRD